MFLDISVSANMWTSGKVLKAPLAFCQEQFNLREGIRCLGLLTFPCEQFGYFLLFSLALSLSAFLIPVVSLEAEIR